MKTQNLVRADQFHPLRGHMMDNLDVQFDNGQRFTVRNRMRGWVLEDAQGREVISPTNDALVFTAGIVRLNASASCI